MMQPDSEHFNLTFEKLLNSSKQLHLEEWDLKILKQLLHLLMREIVM